MYVCMYTHTHTNSKYLLNVCFTGWMCARLELWLALSGITSSNTPRIHEELRNTTSDLSKYTLFNTYRIITDTVGVGGHGSCALFFSCMLSMSFQPTQILAQDNKNTARPVSTHNVSWEYFGQAAWCKTEKASASFTSVHRVLNIQIELYAVHSRHGPHKNRRIRMKQPPSTALRPNCIKITQVRWPTARFGHFTFLAVQTADVSHCLLL
jgi:hypothetical protein